MDLKSIRSFGTGIHPLFSLPSFNELASIRFSVPILGAVCVATFLEQRGIDVTVMDYYRDERSFAEYGVIGISTIFMDLTHLEDVLGQVRLQNKNATIILGGPLGWTFDPKEVLEKNESIDYIVLREGEETFYELINTLKNEGPTEKVEGIVYRKGGQIIQNSYRMSIASETIPSPAWHLLPLKDRLKIFPIETARGCSYECAYCSEVHFWGKPVRFKNTDQILNEIWSAIKKFNVSTFRITDSCFTAPEDRCIRVCDSINKEFSNKDGSAIKWTSYARLNNLDGKLLEKMKSSGCFALDVGWESGDPSILKRMKKSYDPMHLKEVVRIAREIGILIHCNVLIGFPGETDATISRTIEVLEEAHPDSYTCFHLFFARNSYLYDHAVDYDIRGFGLNWQHATMNSDEAKAAVESMFERVTNVNLFPGGEYISCYLASLGFTIGETKSFFTAINNIAKNKGLDNDYDLVKMVDSKLRPFL
jgi:radical SAM superfamily enzyme YgiQ (UPF0313 family)